MKKRKNIVLTTLFIGLMITIPLVMWGGPLMKLYVFGEKTEMIETAEHINALCNANGSCPETLEGWEGFDRWNKRDNVRHHAYRRGQGEHTDEPKAYHAFRLLYFVPIPDHKFMVRGGAASQSLQDG